MSTALSPAAHKVILTGVSWETYERLLAEHQDRTGTRFAYNEGDLEIMVVSAQHENPNRLLDLLVETLAAEFDIDLCPLGSTTFKRVELLKGFEPDSAFYIGRGGVIGGKEIDPAVDPPPDLTIEVDVSSPSLSRFPIFAAFWGAGSVALRWVTSGVLSVGAWAIRRDRNQHGAASADRHYGDTIPRGKPHYQEYLVATARPGMGAKPAVTARTNLRTFSVPRSTPAGRSRGRSP